MVNNLLRLYIVCGTAYASWLFGVIIAQAADLASSANWAQVAMVGITSISTVALAYIALQSKRAETAAKLAAAESKHAATEVQEVKATLEQTGAATTAKLDRVQQQTDGHLSRMAEEMKQLREALAASKQETADVKSEKAALPPEPLEVAIVSVPKSEKSDG